ncbi:MAG TPA: SPFH domain-containing protein, partial [Cytophagales bacterium]|nr:SPFH domain-containing protein [Cytophagales bacterium]
MATLFIFIGIILIIISFVGPRVSPKFTAAGLLRTIAIFVMGLGVLLSSFVMIDAGQVGVKKLFGKVEEDVLESGIHLTNPLVDVIKFDIRTQNYTMAGTHDEGDKMG